MKKLLLLLILTITSPSLFANTYQPEYVRVSSVYCGYTLNDNWEQEAVEECVKVEITDAGFALMKTKGYHSVVVEVKPKNSIWSFVLDVRKAKQAVLTKDDSSETIIFKVRSQSSCGESDFSVRVLEWY